ncbi:hypothetical protein IW262DRAFT_1467643 [Armillaria fumosa]|nr:hypothetical protein IW262DRAFT_1467643 [Armillaria fumosa]
MYVQPATIPSSSISDSMHLLKLCHESISRTIDFDFGARICSKCYEDGEACLLSSDVDIPSLPLVRKSVLTECAILIDGASDDVLDMIPWKDVDEVKAQILSLPEDQPEVYPQHRQLYAKEVSKTAEGKESAMYKKLVVVVGCERDLESIRFTDSLEEHRLIKQIRPLTKKVLDNIRDETYKNSSVGLPYTTILLSLPDFYDFVLVKHILLDLPSSVVVDIKSFDDIIPQLPSLVQVWREQFYNELLRVAGHPNPSCLTSLDQKI